MFSSPAVRLYSSENIDNVVQRKPGNTQLSRKPFVDRSVNSKTPDAGKFLKPGLSIKEPTTIEKPKISPKEDLSAEEFTFFAKEEKDTYGDVWPQFNLGKEGIIKILRNYCSVEDTPPPSPERSSVEFGPIDIDPMFFELPEKPTPKPIAELFPWDDSFEVEVPKLEFDDMDESF